MTRFGIFYVYNFDYDVNYAQIRKHSENIYANQEGKLTMYVYVYEKFDCKDTFLQNIIGNKKVTGTLTENKQTCECNDYPFQEMKQFLTVY